MNPEVIVTNIKKRFTGVSGTVNALLPVQARTLPIAYLGTDMPGAVLAAQHSGERFARLSFWQALRVSAKRLPDGRKRIWHVRRDPEMMLAIFLRDVLRLPISLVFTSAAKHRHSWFPRWLIANMDGVISTTPEAASYVPNTTRVVPHGISLERFSPPDNKLNFFTFFPPGFASTSIPVFSKSSGLVRTSRPIPPGNRLPNSWVKLPLTSANAEANTD